LATPLEALRGIGPERTAQLARLKRHTVGDLLLQPPRRYEDRRHCCKIVEVQLGKAAFIRGTIVAQGIKRYRHGTRSVFEIILEDGTGRLHCCWWNQPYMERYFQVGEEVLVFGKPSSLRPRTIDHPETEKIESVEESAIHLNRVVPVYPLTEGLSQRWLRALVWRLLNEHAVAVPELQPALVLPELPKRALAVRWLHFPGELAEAELARQRLALEEFIELQLAIQRRRINLYAKATGLPCKGDNRWIKPWLARLGFRLTEAQTRVLRQLRQELAGGRPMRRLLQGDVGSGKTVVAAGCALMTLESGFNVTLMAPTEILAEQHFDTFQRWFGPLGIGVQLHTGSRKSAAAEASPQMVIGTHALIETAFSLERLGLVIIDEQHKFGVAQRERLVRKGHYPHLLVMTATPIPRTLALTLYGDLEVSILDQFPAGRGQIRTFVRTAERLPKVWEFIRTKLAEGRQAYVVYSRVEETDQNGLKAVTQEWEKLQQTLAPCRVGLLHGRLPTEEKEQVMAAFREGQLDVLLATTVVEVGLDVPNATVMLIENAEQFGLAQLHQMRGRIGRGPHDAYCILVAAAKTIEAKQRLQVLVETTDGFRIAEADLALRGPGELLGQQQSGAPQFRCGNLAKDGHLVERARGLAAELLARDASVSSLG
jgi:ATP-dependent DNA helicase RecG